MIFLPKNPDLHDKSHIEQTTVSSSIVNRSSKISVYQKQTETNKNMTENESVDENFNCNSHEIDLNEKESENNDAEKENEAVIENARKYVPQKCY